MRQTPAEVRALWTDSSGRCLLRPTEGDIVAAFAERLASCPVCDAWPLYLVDGVFYELLDPPTLLTMLKTIDARRHRCADEPPPSVAPGADQQETTPKREE